MLEKYKLNTFYDLIKETILKNQNSITGLIPASEENSHAWVRDNCYAVLSVWGLSLAYRKISDLDEDRSKGYELEKCSIKLMRGLLICFMKQANKVEAFKNAQKLGDCLHAKYDSQNCNSVVGDFEWGHLQMDSISLFLLIVAQMTASGMHIIWTHDEVSFIQNLIFYIEMAYRIPDYGIWERGDKTNHGLPELNCSSVGMAKAALEAMSDLDLFGPHGGPKSVIQSFPDECQQCNAVLESMLPRESCSKELDSALLSIISYPAFAVNDEEIIETTRNKIVNIMLGKYGCKRFLRDGFRTPMEDPNRLHYEPHELRMFENNECEWPMFFAYLALDASFRDENKLALQYIQKMEAVMLDKQIPMTPVPSSANFQGIINAEAGNSNATNETRSNSIVKLLPESYAVTKPVLHNSSKDRGDSPARTIRQAKGNIPHVWGQSLYVLAKLVAENIITTGEIDPLGRRMQLEPKPDLVVQVSVMVENEEHKQILLNQNIISQTSEELFRESAIKVYPARTLIYILKGLGKCEALNLNGRVSKEVGILATSRLYLIGEHMVAFQPQFMDTKDFYISLDYDFIVDVFRSNVAFLRRVWSNPGRPTLIIPIFSKFFKPDGTLEKSILTTLMKLNSGYIYGTRVKLGTLSDFVSTSFVTKLSFLHEKGDDVVKKLNPQKSSPRKIDLLRHSSVDASSNFKSLALRRKSVALTNAILVDLEGNESYNRVFDMERWGNESDDALVQRMISSKSVEEDAHVLKPSNLLKHGSKTELKSSAVHLKNIVSESTKQDKSHYEVSPLQKMSSEELLNRMQQTNDLAEQGEILYILWQREGLNYEACVNEFESYTIKQMLIEFYDKAGDASEWWLVRFISGLLDKRVDVLAKSLTDLLIRQKQVSVGLPPEPREIVIISPMGPQELSELIQKACGEDYAMRMLTQEILVYLAMFARTEPQLLSQMLRLRVGLIIQVMASELARAMQCPAMEASTKLYDLSPSQTKLLLQHILSGREFTLSTIQMTPFNTERVKKERRKSVIQSVRSTNIDKSQLNPCSDDDPEFVFNESDDTSNNRIGQWIRRRKIDGALNRVPFKFYEKLWIVIERVQEIIIADRSLANGLTKEMTQGEIKFALVVESILNRVLIPEYRQLIVETLCVLSNVIELDSTSCSIDLAARIDTGSIINRANHLFLLDQASFKGDSVLCCAKTLHSSSVIEGLNRSHSNSPPQFHHDGLGHIYEYGSANRRNSLICKGGHGICNNFYDSSPSGRYGTMTYLFRALSEIVQLPHGKSQESNIDCQVQ